MPTGKMHADEVRVSPALAAHLVAAQFGQWVGLPLMPLAAGGSDNTLIRMGENLVLRFPRRAEVAAQVAVEAAGLPQLAPYLPLAVPRIAGVGAPGFGYRFPWLVLHWLPGIDAHTAPPGDDLATARVLAGFVQALRGVQIPEAMPRMGHDRHLRPRDAFTRTMIARITDEADPALINQRWAQALALPDWNAAPVIVHADLHPLNLLTEGGTLTAVIDWGGLCAGDAAHDLICAWMVLQDAGRALFRDVLQVDDATWARGRALAFSKAVMAAPYYRDTNPALRDVMRTALTRTLADWPD